MKHFNVSSANRRTRAACRTLGHGPRPAQRLAADFRAKMFAMSFRFCRGPKYQNIGCIDADFFVSTSLHGDAIPQIESIMVGDELLEVEDANVDPDSCSSIMTKKERD